jgi:hypothetical protein
MEEKMKPEDHVQFLYELINLTGELQSLIDEYCRKITPNEEDIEEFSPHCHQGDVVF